MSALTALDRWQVKPRAPAAALEGLRVDSPLLAQLLLNRGLADATEAARFLDAEGEALGNPFAMADMHEALERIAAAIRAGEPIVVYGDYDVDGLSGATLLKLALEAAGAQVEVFIPHRERDGYGLSSAVLESLAAGSTRLVISVDCGVSAAAEVAAAARAGLDVVVTDHHQVPAELPRAVAVLNPHRSDCPYPFKYLAGAGVALRLAQAILQRFQPSDPAQEIQGQLFELAALGTVADVMPLIGENRAIVRRGLDKLNASPSPGLRALIRHAGLARGWINAESVAFGLAPRLNAAGRIAEALTAHRLLAARTDAEANQLAEQLEELNARRRVLLEEALARARAELAALGPSPPSGIVLHGEYPAGLLGLVAARLSEETARPVAALQAGDELCRGSVRGVPGFDTVAAVGACGELLLAYGGHRGAAGLSIAPANVEAFRARFAQVVAPALAALPPPGPAVADCRLRATTVDYSLCQLLARLEPFGEGNPAPLFETRGLLVREIEVVGERHLRLRVAGGGTRLRAIFFGGAADSGPSPDQVVDLLYRVRPNYWQDSLSVELDVVAWRPSAA
ncbi:MAG TPA: single-stranded-DNA-specific exonuclease RecJ [Chloroflexota bacterium]|nr:single-stranded-DNA-specific exonuclease RecJ [Chloroflexota bacterium]